MGDRVFHFSIDDEERLDLVAQALNTPIRRKIMTMLSTSSYSIADLKYAEYSKTQITGRGLHHVTNRH